MDKADDKFTIGQEDELDSYLDDVLDEFNAPLSTSKQVLSSTLPEAPDDNSLDQDFADQLAKGMEELVADMESNPEGFQKNMEQLMHQFENSMLNNDGAHSSSLNIPANDISEKKIANGVSTLPITPSNGSLQDRIADTMNKLKTSSEIVGSQVQAGMDQDLMTQMMKQMESLADSGDFNNMLENMMKSLLSKDVLYEPMKDLSAKYPIWLQENKSKLSEEDYTRYTKQLRYVEKIMAVYDGSSSSYEESTNHVVELMQGMQECGNPPSEILKELAPGLEMGPDGAPKMPDLNDKDCFIM